MCFFVSFSLFLIKYFQLCICIVTSLVPFVVNKAYHKIRKKRSRQTSVEAVREEEVKLRGIVGTTGQSVGYSTFKAQCLYKFIRH